MGTSLYHFPNFFMCEIITKRRVKNYQKKFLSICVCGVLGSMRERMYLRSREAWKSRSGVYYFWQLHVAECFWNTTCGEGDGSNSSADTLKAVGSCGRTGHWETGGDWGEKVIQMERVTKICCELAKRNFAQGCYSLLSFFVDFLKI